MIRESKVLAKFTANDNDMHPNSNTNPADAVSPRTRLGYPLARTYSMPVLLMTSSNSSLHHRGLMSAWPTMDIRSRLV